MDIMELGAIGELVGGVAVIGSLIFVGLQVRQSNRLTQAEAVQAFVHAHNRDVVSPLQDQAFAKTFRRGLNDFQNLTKEEQMAVHGLLLKILFMGQTHFLLHRHRLMQGEFANAMQALDVRLLRSPGVAQWWNAMRPLIAPDYAAHLDGLLERYEGPALTELLPWCEPDGSEMRA